MSLHHFLRVQLVLSDLTLRHKEWIIDLNIEQTGHSINPEISLLLSRREQHVSSLLGFDFKVILPGVVLTISYELFFTLVYLLGYILDTHKVCAEDAFKFFSNWLFLDLDETLLVSDDEVPLVEHLSLENLHLLCSLV
jgi:hypothetical protein